MIGKIVTKFRQIVEPENISDLAKEENERDLLGLPSADPGIDRSIKLCVDWIGNAQDNSRSNDGGVARDYSLNSGWNTSYPETTGYIVPTLIDHAKAANDNEALARAKKMLDWLVSIQFDEGGFQGGVIGAEPRVPVTFNTGQILLGLAAGTAEFGEEYREAMRRAASWLSESQDSDGCWRRHRTPFAEPSDKAYETHVSWGLFEAARLGDGDAFADAAVSNVDWALTMQNDNGWFRNCCLSDPENPLTHTIGYVLRGIIEAYRYTNDERYLNAAIKTADSLLKAVRKDGELPGRLDEDWTGVVGWSCLTGNVQIAACWLMLFEYTGRHEYLFAALKANRYVRRTLRSDGDAEMVGGVKGSFPVSGGYCTYEYPNWAAKFTIDSLMMEKRICAEIK